jgi:radical SAM superfamily enzyme YgiQ (UPF0313 family)
LTIPWKTRAQAKERLAKEQGAHIADWGGHVPVALLYPNSYYIGMSSLGFQAVYSLFNSTPGMLCERAFVDSPKQAKRQGLVTIESQRELWEFSVLAVSLSFELDYWNTLAALAAAGIPLRSSDRDDTHPLIIAGGPAVSANPEPLAPFLDAVIIGEAEAVLPQAVPWLTQSGEIDRMEMLQGLASVPGIYVPALYEVDYHTDGTISKIQSIDGAAACPVRRQWLDDLNSVDTSSKVLTRDTEFGNMYLIEVARGCARQCRFCLAGYYFLPKRERSVEKVLALAQEGLRYRDRIGLVGSAVSDYSGINEVSTRLLEMGAKISVSSLRVDSLTRPLLEALVKSQTRTLTIAPEVGSERMSKVIGKGIGREHVLQAAAEAAGLGIRQFKLYFMVGLPTETEEDVQAIVELAKSTKAVVEKSRPGSSLSINVSPFVPKAHTPFQRYPMLGVADLHARLGILETALRPKQIQVKGEGPAWSAIQGVLARGDRRLSKVLENMATQSSLSNWKRAMADAGLEDAFYTQRQREAEEILPWSVVSSGVLDQYLQRSASRGLQASGPGGCQGERCGKCGVCRPGPEHKC